MINTLEIFHSQKRLYSTKISALKTNLATVQEHLVKTQTALDTSNDKIEGILKPINSAYTRLREQVFTTMLREKRSKSSDICRYVIFI